MTSVQSASVASSGSLTRNERLDRLPFNKAHRKLLVASGIGWAFDAMDVGLVSFVVAAIAADPHFNLTPTEKSWVLSIGFVGMAIGAALGGFVADRVGRKTVFSATLVIFGLANGGMALSWSLAALLIARLIIGLGLGAELPVASTLVSEFSPTKQRGRMTDAVGTFWAVGWIVCRLHWLLCDSEYRRLGLALGFAHWRVAAAVCHCDACSYSGIRAIPGIQGA